MECSRQVKATGLSVYTDRDNELIDPKHSVLAAHSQKLTAQVKAMSLRIQELENALQLAGLSAGPTLSRASAGAETPWESTVQGVSVAIDTLSIDVEKQGQREAGSEVCCSRVAFASQH